MYSNPNILNIDFFFLKFFNFFPLVNQQVFDNTPAAKSGKLASGDEIVAINGKSVKGMTKGQLAKTIQSTNGDVKVNFNKLHADPKQGKTLDIVLKKLKHRLVEQMDAGQLLSYLMGLLIL